MRAFFALMILITAGCKEIETRVSDPPCTAPALESMTSYVPHVTVMLKACHAYKDLDLLITMNDTVIIDEKNPPADGDKWTQSYREGEVVYVYPYDKWDNRLDRIEVRLYGGDCTYTDKDGTSKAGRELLAADEFDTSYPGGYYGGCGYYAYPAQSELNLICGTPMCVPPPNP